MAHALVTGANRGLGLAFVHALLARGDRVVAACRQPGRATALNAAAGEHPGRLHVLPLDVARAASIAEFARELPLVAESLDLVVHCAGVLHSGERFGELKAELLEDAFRVNALGPLLLTQALAPRLAEGSKVVAMASEIGSIARVEAFRTPGYAISKAALNMALAQLAQALSPGCWRPSTRSGPRTTAPSSTAPANRCRGDRPPRSEARRRGAAPSHARRERRSRTVPRSTFPDSPLNGAPQARRRRPPHHPAFTAPDRSSCS